MQIYFNQAMFNIYFKIVKLENKFEKLVQAPITFQINKTLNIYTCFSKSKRERIRKKYIFSLTSKIL